MTPAVVVRDAKPADHARVKGFGSIGTIPGAWWHPHNVPGVLALRTLKANGWWEEYWSVQRTAWRQRAQSFRLRDERRTQLPNAA